MAEVTDPAPATAPGSAPEPAPIHVVTGVDALARDDERLFFAVGVFDGLHRGHAYLLRHLRSAARAHGARAAVITFDAHPDAVILGHAPALLLDPVERLGRLACAGVAVTVVQHFDEALRRTPYDVFVHAIASRTHLAGFLMTPEAAFGHERRGTPQALATLGAELGYEVVVVAPFELDGGPVRSERIRRCIEEGDLGEARRLLGRSLAVVGTPAAVTGGLAEVTFGLPVALPPPGRYRATLETPWTVDGPVGSARRGATVEIAGDRVVVPAEILPPAGRVRIALHAAARGRSRSLSGGR